MQRSRPFMAAHSSKTPKKNENQDSPVILILPYLGPEFKLITNGTWYSIMYSHIHAHSNTSHNSQRGKQPRCLSTDKWINKLWCIRRMEYYSATKRLEILIHATIVQPQKHAKWKKPDNKGPDICVISYIWTIQNRYFYRDKKQTDGCQGHGEGRIRSNCLMGPSSFWGDENVLERDSCTA